MSAKNKNFISGFLVLAPYPIILGAQIFFANQLSVREVGLFAFFSLVLGVIFTATNWGGDKYIISKDSISRIEVDRVFSFELALAFTLFLIYVAFLHENFITYLGLEDSNYLLLAMGLCFCYHPLSRCKALLERSKNFLYAYSPLFIANILSLIIGYICLRNGLGLLSMIIWKASSYIFELLILFFLAPRIPRLSINFSLPPSAYAFCWPIFLGGLIGFIGTNADYYLVSTFMGPEQLGIYWMAFSLSSILLIFRDAITRLLLPILARKPSKADKIFLFKNLNGALQVAGVLSAIIITYASEFLFTNILGDKWIESAIIFVVLFFAAVYKLIGGICGALLYSVMKTKIAFNVSALSIFILLPSTYIAIKVGGLTMVASAVLFSILIINLIVYETSIKKLSGHGFLNYFSYLSLNIFSLYLISILLLNNYPDPSTKLLAFIFSISFSIITFPINNVLQRSKALFT